MGVAFYPKTDAMSKGDKTKQFIIDSAAELYSRKTYSGVTMKDICEKSGLSRGGVYRYFGSTKEIVIEILKKEISDEEKKQKKILAAEKGPEELLIDLLQHQKKALIEGRAWLNIAFYEFSLLEPDQYPLLMERYSAAEKSLSMLIKQGQKANVFKPGDVETVVRHILFLLEGLMLSSVAAPIPENVFNEQIQFMTQLVLKDKPRGKGS
ncbi:TetR/AcrR family transcriptional regulator [Breznakiella homolactica]|uniref:TetR/AcrR family transcriptional regulator n=1 Tax=Breznakiella homolactica TaxID=2798577 RepID=A0A7T8B8F1_9SPIR|nr:TetR/AcrR family transcriptional regulator [Breznakiella homolactica]QQO08524.1 TetR/AcrR family transcriptional regulator [Breznakiella homolactica]